MNAVKRCISSDTVLQQLDKAAADHPKAAEDEQ